MSPHHSGLHLERQMDIIPTSYRLSNPDVVLSNTERHACNYNGILTSQGSKSSHNNSSQVQSSYLARMLASTVEFMIDRRTTYCPSGKYLLTTSGIFFSLSSFIAICNGSVSPSKSTSTGAFILRTPSVSIYRPYLSPLMASDIPRIYTPDLQRPCPQHPRPLILGHIRRRTPQLIRDPLALWPRPTKSYHSSIANLDDLPSITTGAVYCRPRRHRTVDAGGLGVRVGVGRGRGLRVRGRIAGRGVRVMGREGRLFVVKGGFLGFVLIAGVAGVS